MALVLSVLLFTAAGLIPNIEQCYCRADAVVLAVVARVETCPSGGPPALVELRVTESIKGPLHTAEKLKLEGRVGLTVGAEYLFFIALEKQAVLASVNCPEAGPTPLRKLSFSYVAPASADSVAFDTDEMVFPLQLLSVEAQLEHRRSKKPFALSLPALRKLFASLSNNACKEGRAGA